MQAEYPKKINPTHWDRVHIQPRVRKFPDTGISSETIARVWRPPPEVIQELRPQVPELINYDRDYTVTNQLTRSQTSEDFGYKAPETHRFNKHTAAAENKYIYPPSRRLEDQPPLNDVHGTTEMRDMYKIPKHPPSLVTEKNQHKHPAFLPSELPMVEPSWHKDLPPLDTTYEGYEKYLDPYLTTSRLHHRPYTAEQLSRRSVTKDIVTYHTLSKEPWMMADSTSDNNANVANENPDNQEDPPPGGSPEPEHRLVFDWPINIVVSEPKIIDPDPDLAQQGRAIQKLGPEWKTVRYADVKRQFEPTAPFRPLFVNYPLDSLTPKCKAFDVLERFDHTLAAISYGLLKQKKILQNTLDNLPAAVHDAVRDAFESVDSQYNKISEDLLQYVCGRRSQVIQHRREMFLPRNLGVRQALHAIPPTDRLLFEQNRLTQLVEALPNKIDHFVPNTDKCRCCQSHKQRRRRQSSEEQNSGEEEPPSPERKRRRKQRRRRNSSDEQNSDEDSSSPDRKRHRKQRRQRHSSGAQNSEAESRSKKKRRH